MARVSRGVTARARHKKVIKRAKGYYGRRKNVFRVAVQAVERGMQYAYRDRKKRKSDFRGGNQWQEYHEVLQQELDTKKKKKNI